MPRSTHVGSNSSSAPWSRSVYRFASSSTSMSVSRANRASMADWFMPAPTARSTPSERMPLQGGPRLRDGRRPMLVRVMDERDVDPIEAQALQALFEGAANAIGAVVEHEADRLVADIERVVEAVEALVVDVGIRRDRRLVTDESAHLGRQDECVAGPTPKSLADPSLRNAVPIQRRGIEGANTEVPRMANRGDRVVVGNLREQAADRCATEAEARNGETGPSEWHPLSGVDGHGSCKLRSGGG